MVRGDGADLQQAFPHCCQSRPDLPQGKCGRTFAHTCMKVEAVDVVRGSRGMILLVGELGAEAKELRPFLITLNKSETFNQGSITFSD